MLDFSAQTSLGNISRPSNAVLACANPVQQQISSLKDGTRPAFVKTRCQKCWACVTTKKNILLGRYLAECATVERIELWTLTYGSATPEARLGAKQRCIEHVQKFQKAVRQREQRGLRTYNRRETKAAAADGREPRLVDLKQSYVTFHPVFEFGSANGRGHFHVVLFWHSHFPIAEHVLSQQEPPVCPELARRVWELKRIVSPPTPKRPPGARDPDVIDWRVQKDGSQTHGLWPYGLVNIECLSHDLRASDRHGRSAPRRSSTTEIQEGLRYTLKYLDKPDTDKFGKPLSETELGEQDARLANAKGGSRLFRTGSQGMGKRYAKAWGRLLAFKGVPLNHVHFRVSGVNVKRGLASMAKFEAKLRSRNLTETQILAYTLDAQKLTFQMHGAMRDACVDAYLDAQADKGTPQGALGDVGLARLRQLAAKKKNEQLRSVECEFQRAITRDLTPTDQSWMAGEIAKLSNCAQEMLDTGWDAASRLKRWTLPVRILPPEPFEGFQLSERPVPTPAWLKMNGIGRRTEIEKLGAVLAAIGYVERVYSRNWVDPFKLQTEKHKASRIGDLGMEFVPHERRRLIVNQDAVTQAIFEENERAAYGAFMDGTGDYDDCRLASQAARGRAKPPEFDAWSCVENGVPSELRLRWLNHSDQYEFEKQRERHVQRYCLVHQVDPDRRLIVTPDGRVLFGSKLPIEKPRACLSAKDRRVFEVERRGRPVRFRYREITELRQLGDIEARIFPAGMAPQTAPIFRPDLRRPFANIWAMRPDALQSAVAQLRATEKEPTPRKPLAANWRTAKRVDA